MKAEGKKILPPLSVDLFQSWDFGRTCQFWLDLLLLNPLIQPQLQAFGLGSSVDSGEAKMTKYLMAGNLQVKLP